jgi:hypothetical protein
MPNPFDSTSSNDPATAVRLDYQGLEVWAAEHGQPRSPEMTSTEFARSLMSVHPELRDGIRTLVRLHAGMVYAERTPAQEELPPVAILWNKLAAYELRGV